MREIDRRAFLVTGGLALAGLAAACSKKEPAAGGETIRDLVEAQRKAGAGQMQVIQAVGEVLVRPDARVSFALVDATGSRRLTAGSIRVYAAPGPDVPVAGPVEAVYHGEGLGEKGVYVARIAFERPGAWSVLAVGTPAEAPGELYGEASFMAVAEVSGPAPGAKAGSVPTPTVQDHRGVEPYCTRTPPCSLHAISLDVALANGKPTVFSIGTPRFCTSRTCGPVLDVIESASKGFGGMNFVHAEVYANDTDAPATQRLAPAPAAWKLSEEPITYWIRPDGTILERIVGPTDVAEVRALMQALAV